MNTHTCLNTINAERPLGGPTLCETHALEVPLTRPPGSHDEAVEQFRQFDRTVRAFHQSCADCRATTLPDKCEACGLPWEQDYWMEGSYLHCVFCESVEWVPSSTKATQNIANVMTHHYPGRCPRHLYDSGNDTEFVSVKQGKGRGTLLTCGDVESNPGPDSIGGILRNVLSTRSRSRSRSRGRRGKTNTVRIQGKTTIVAPNNSQSNKRRRNRRRKQRGVESQVFENSGNHCIPEGQIVEMTAGDDHIPEPEQVLPEHVQGWLMRNTNPCGEFRTRLDYGKVPDGALPQSAAGQFREVMTLRYPGATPMEAPLNGAMWSLCVLHTPLWRTPFIFIADMVRAEVSDAAIAAVIESVNNIANIEAARYPEWLATTMDGVYWQFVQWSAIRQLPPPSDSGASPVIQDFRITGDGFTMTFNTPDLINQGIAVSAQFNQNTKKVDAGYDHDETGTAVNYDVIWNTASAPHNVHFVLPGLGEYPWNGTLPLTTPSTGTPQSRTSTLVATDTYVAAGPLGTPITWYSTGDGVRFLATFNPLGPGGVFLTIDLEVSAGNTGDNWAPLGFSWRNLTSNSGPGRVGEDYTHTQKFNQITMPPITQEDLMQQTPKAVVFQLKATDGVYVVKRVWQPVYNMTPASDYGPVRLATTDTTATELAAAVGVLNDTLDSNYGFSVTNFSSLPLACQPYFKAIRSWEVVPGRGSPWGPFTTTNPPKEQLAEIISRTIGDLDPFAYPEAYNGFGLMFAKIMKVVTKIPRVLRSAANVSEAVASCCESAQAMVAGGRGVAAITHRLQRVNV